MPIVSLTASRVKSWIPKRPLHASKHTNGHVLIVAGSRGMSGAACLSTLGALRAGAGLVTTAIVSSERLAVTRWAPEALTLPLPFSSSGQLTIAALQTIHSFLKKRRVDAVVIGPGLGRTAAVKTVVQKMLKTISLPVILDADGLFAISPKQLFRTAPTIVTPHAGEFARLFGKRPKDVAKKKEALVAWVGRTHGQTVCVLKGHHSLVSDGRTTYRNPTGSPALATGGTGDVLSGVIAALVAQGLPPLSAAAAGAYLHGLAADLITISDRGLLARDVAQAIPRAFSKIGVKR